VIEDESYLTATRIMEIRLKKRLDLEEEFEKRLLEYGWHYIKQLTDQDARE